MNVVIATVGPLAIAALWLGIHLFTTRERGERLADARPEPRTLEDWHRESARSLRRARHRR